MADPIKSVQNALVHAKFEDASIKAATGELLEKLRAELYEAGYEPGTEIEKATTNLEEAISLVDEPPDAENGEDDEEVDPFAGLGDDDDKE